MAASVRRSLDPYCQADPYNVSGRPEGSGRPGYVIRSLYLDTPSLAFHRAKERGDPERFKLRIRRYEGSTPPFLELKRRYSDFIAKTRFPVAEDQIEEAALGQAKPRNEGTAARRFLQEFSRLVVSSGAGPSLLVRYEREAYVSLVDEYARLSFDRRVAAQRVRSWDLDGDADEWCELEDHLSAGTPWSLVTLEIKCGSRVPYWISDILRGHDLRRRSFSKYSIGIYMTGCQQGISSHARRVGRVLN